MTAPTLDDLDAVRAIVTTLEPFDAQDRVRVLRWACEKLGIAGLSSPVSPLPTSPASPSAISPMMREAKIGSSSIRDFVTAKRPSSDNQFATVVAYYFRFEAPEEERKEAISSDDLQDACRTAGRQRLANPAKTLHNAHSMGLLDKSSRGNYRINSVGENLVAMTLPGGESTSQSPRKRTKKVTRSSTKSATKRSGKAKVK